MTASKASEPTLAERLRSCIGTSQGDAVIFEAVGEIENMASDISRLYDSLNQEANARIAAEARAAEAERKNALYVACCNTGGIDELYAKLSAAELDAGRLREQRDWLLLELIDRVDITSNGQANQAMDVLGEFERKFPITRTALRRSAP